MWRAAVAIGRSPIALAPLPIAVGLLLAACDQPPTREIGAAEAAVEQARSGGAAQFAPERFREAEAALADARQKLQAREYRDALSSATDAADKSRRALQAATAARKLARGAVEVAQVEIQAGIDEFQQARDAARKAKVPDAAFEDVDASADQVRKELASLSETLAGGDVLAAQKQVVALKGRAASLGAEVRQARQGWEAERPKARGRARPARPRG
jgi:hypothetical protein